MFGRIKGTVLLACVKALRMQRDAALPFLSERTRRFLGEERILPSTWYEESDAFELYRAYARASAGGVSMKVWHEMGRQAARGHAEEAYRHVVKARDTASILCTGAVALHAAQHDTGKVTTQLVSPSEVTVDIRGFGAMCPEWSHMLAGYLRGLAEATHAEQIDVRIVETDFAAHAACYRVTWREAASG